MPIAFLKNAPFQKTLSSNNAINHMPSAEKTPSSNKSETPSFRDLFKYIRLLPLLIATAAASLGLRLGLILMSLHTF